MKEFCNELRRLSGVSEEYTNAAFYTIGQGKGIDYKIEAKRYCKRFKLSL